MKTKKVIKLSSLPTRAPFGAAVLYWLLLEHMQAASWAYGVFWTLFAILVFTWIFSFWTEEPVDVPGFGD